MNFKEKFDFRRIHWALIFSIPLFICLILSFYLFSRWQELGSLKERVEYTHQKAMGLKRKKDQEEKILEALKNTSAFTEKQLEKLIFLNPEIQKLQLLSEQNEASKKRLRFLKSEDNQLRFMEEKRRQGSGVKEVELKQRYPVEMNEEDLKNIFTIIEGVSLTSATSSIFPHCLIRNFTLEKKNIPLEEERVYLIHFDLIKRELLK